MDLYIDRDALSRGLARVQGIIERRSTHPMLAHVLLHARDGSLRMTATDTEVAYIGDLPANVEQPGDLAVDATSLFQVIRALPEPTVQLGSGANNRLEIRCGRSFFRLPGTPSEEYPALPAFDARGVCRLPERQLRRLVEQTSFAVATDDVRYGLNGAHLEEVDGANEEKRVRMIATDGHRLASAEAAFDGDLLITQRTLIPRKALAVLRKLLDTSDESIEVSFGEGAIRLSRPDQTFWFRLLEGEFPDYHAVVPKENRHQAMVRHRDLASTLKRVMILVQDRPRAVRFAFDETELQIDTFNVDRGEVKEAVPIELTGEPITVGFNVRYLSDALAAMQGERVLLELAHPLAPCLVRDPDSDESFFVVMPMRLD